MGGEPNVLGVGFPACGPPNTLSWDAFSFGADLVNDDPLFTAPVAPSATPSAAGDYTLDPASPCLEAGDPSSTTSTDVLLRARPFPALTDPDMGAYEDHLVPIPLPPKITMWWPFDTIYKTLPPKAPELINNHKATIYNSASPLGPGMVSNAFDCSGGRYAQAPDHPLLDVGTTDVSIMAWIKTTTSSRAIVDKRDPGTQVGYLLYLYNGRLLFQMHDGSGFYNYYATSGPTVTDGEWHFVAVTLDRSETDGGKLYVDDNLVHTFNPTNRPGSLANTAPLNIGRHINGTTFNGMIDELMFSSMPQPQSTIEDIFDAGPAGVDKNI